MKNKNVFKIIICICIVSLAINTMYFLSSNKKSKDFVNSVYFSVRNIEKSLENLEFGLESKQNKEEISSTLEDLENECRVVDDPMTMVGHVINKEYTSKKLMGLSQLVSLEINGDSDLESKLEFVNNKRNEIKTLLQMLSKNQEIMYDEYKNILMNPDYSLSIKKIIKILHQIESNKID